MLRSIVFFCLGIFLFGCAGNNSSSTSAVSSNACYTGTTVERFSSNQPSIKVTGVPKDQADFCLFWRQGYEEAKDRFLQMDLARRLAQGTLSEIFGEETLENDQNARAAGVALSSQRSLANIRQHFPVEYQALVGFSDGVNEYLKVLPKEHPEWAATYRKYTQDVHYTPAPWTPLDSLSIGTAVSFGLSSQLFDKVVTGLLSLLYQGPVEDFVKHFDYRPITDRMVVGDHREELGLAIPVTRTRSKDTDIRLPTRRSKEGSWDKIKRALPQLWKMLGSHCKENNLHPFLGCGRVAPLGSNNWAVSPQASGSPHVLLANDTHLPIQSPSGMYEVALNSVAAGGLYAVAGVNLPGVPGILIGHNLRIGWTLTNFGVDTDDGYFEEVDADGKNVVIATREEMQPDPDRPGQKKLVTVKTWGPVHSENTILKVRLPGGGVEERNFAVRTIRNGQRVLLRDGSKVFRMISDYLSDDSTKMDIGYRWTGHQGSTVFVSVLRLNQAQNFAQFQAAQEFFDVGAQNFVYGDVDGNIGYEAHGLFPNRPFLSRSTPPGMLLNGNGSMEWDGFRKDVPQLYNPEDGIIVSANNDAWGHSLSPDLSSFKDYLGYSFSTGIRAERIYQLLDSKRGKGMTVEDMQKFQFDHYDLLAEKFLALVRQHKDQLDLTKPEVKELVESLLSWDLQTIRSRKEPVLFYAWIETVLDHFFDPIIGPTRETLEMTIKDPEAIAKIEDAKKSSLMLKTSYHKLNDVLSSDKPETGVAMLQETLEATLVHLQAKNLRGVRWGESNRLAFKNFLNKIVPSFVTLPIERDGSFETVDVNFSERQIAPNFRMTLVMKPGGIEGYNVIPGGNFSPFERDGLYNEIMLWREGGVRKLVPILN